MITLKKIVASFAALAIVMSQNVALVSYAQSIPSQYVDAYNFAYENGLTSMSSAEAFMPFATMTREAAARFMVKFADLIAAAQVEGQDCSFSDLGSADQSLVSFINDACAKYAIMKGSNGAFMPKASVTRGQMITMLSRALYGNQYDSTSADYWTLHANRLVEDGIITVVNADQLVLRGDAMIMLMRAYDMNGGDDLGDLLGGLLGSGSNASGSTNTGVVVEVKAGNLNVALSPSSAQARSVPGNGVVPVGTFRLTAGSSDVTVRSITVRRTGLGNQDEISRLFFEMAGMRVSGRQTLGTDQKAIINISPAIVVKANSSEDLDLNVVYSGVTSNGQHVFAIDSVDSVDSSAAAVQGAWPVMTNMVTTTSYSVLKSTFNTTSGSNTLKVGDMDSELGRFNITNNDSNKVAVLKSITLRNDGAGDVAMSLSNVVVTRNGQAVSTKVVPNGRLMTVTFNDEINAGVQANYIIRANVIGVENVNGDDYKFRLQQNDDLNVIEKDTAFKSNVTSTATTMGTYTVQGGDITFNRTAGSLTTQTISAGQQDQKLLDGQITVKQAVRFETLTVSFQTGAYTGNYGAYFQNVKLVIGGRIVSNVSPTITSANTITFDGTFDVTSNTDIKILGTVRSNIPATTPSPIFKLNDLNPSQFAVKEYIVNGNTVSSIAGTVQGIATTVGAVTLTVSKADGLANEQVVRGTSNKLVFAVRLTAGDVSEVRVSSLKFGNLLSNGGAFFPGSSLVSLTLSTGANGVALPGATKNMETVAGYSSGGAVFNSFGNIVVPKNGSVTFYVTASFASSIATGSQLQLSFGTSDIQATDDQGNSITPSFATVNGSVMTMRDAGTLNLSSNGQINSRLLLGAGANENVYSFDLAAQDDDLRLTDIYVQFTGANAVNGNDRIASIKLLSGSTVVNEGIVFASGARFNLTDSSTETLRAGKTKTYTVRVELNAPTSSGSYIATGLQLILGTGGVDASQVNAGTTNGIRALSVNAGSAVVVNNTPSAGQQHSVSQAHVTLAALPSANNFNGATVAYKFKITPSANTNVVVMSGLTINCSYAGAAVNAQLIVGDTNTATTNNQLSTSTALTTATDIALNVTLNTGSARFSSENTFTVVLNSAMAAGAKSCTIKDVRISEEFSNGFVRTIGSLSPFGNVGFGAGMPTLSLQ